MFFMLFWSDNSARTTKHSSYIKLNTNNTSDYFVQPICIVQMSICSSLTLGACTVGLWYLVFVYVSVCIAAIYLVQSEVIYNFLQAFNIVWTSLKTFCWGDMVLFTCHDDWRLNSFSTKTIPIEDIQMMSSTRG